MAKPAPQPIPAGMAALTTHLWFNGQCREAIEFYQKAFGAERVGQIVPAPQGNGVLHAMLKFGDANLMMADTIPGEWEKGPVTSTTAALYLYVADCDAIFQQATAAGCEVLQPMADMFWGDRTGKLKDPYGHCWNVATHKFDFTPEEMQKGQEEWLASLPN